ncbi:MAG TPA: T9SS type A sorting domain-containing protein [Bacteroidia bacterium]|nr:T9SS type A sorting domain-containing protein [Bacteroidia bacterium]
MKKITAALVLDFLFSIINCSAQQSINWQWAKQGISTGSSNESVSTATDHFHHIYTTGYFESPAIIFDSLFVTSNGYYDIFLAKHDENGNILWVRSAGGTNSDLGKSVATDLDGNIYVTGVFYSTSITFGSTNLLNNSGSDFFLAKYDSAGNVLWAKNMGGNGSDNGEDVAIDANGNVYVTGAFHSPLVIFGSDTLINNGQEDIFVAKFDSSGNVLWVKNPGGSSYDEGVSICTDANSNILITGFFSSPSITFGNIVLTNPGIFVAKYDSSGNVLWAKGSGGLGGSGRGICTDKSNNILLTGSFENSISFDSITLTGTWHDQVFIAKYDASGNALWAKRGTGINQDFGEKVVTDNNKNVYIIGSFNMPYITFDSTTINGPLNSVSPLFIAIFDSLGNIICTEALESGGWSDGMDIAMDDYGGAYITSNFSEPNIFTIGNDSLFLTGNENVFLAKFNSGTVQGINNTDFKKNKITFYPNPAFDIASISLNNIENRAGEIRIIDVYGKIVYVQQLQSLNSNLPIKINVSNFSKGIYFFIIADGKGKTVNKFVKE